MEGERRQPTLVDILIEVLDDLDGTAHLNVNMALVTTGEVRVIGNDPTVVDRDGGASVFSWLFHGQTWWQCCATERKKSGPDVR